MLNGKPVTLDELAAVKSYCVSRCPSCRGALPGGCSACRPMPMGRVRLERGAVTHTCPECMRGLPCTSSLSATIGHIVNRRNTTDTEWKASAFRNQADGSWDANGSPVEAM